MAAGLVYTTQRVVKIPNRCLALTYYIIVFVVIVYIGGYGLGYSKAYQARSEVESVVVTKVKGVLRTQFTDKELAVPNPEFYRRVWDANDIITPAHGGEAGGFFILTNVIITPNQTRGFCPEAQTVEGAQCKQDRDCVVGKALKLGNGVMTGKCITNDRNNNIRTCEVEAWCPLERSRVPLDGMKKPLLDVRDFTVLVKNSIEFPDFGSNYKRRNIIDGATNDYLKMCVYDQKKHPYCPTFRIGSIVSEAKEDFNTVALTGAVFALQIRWDCSFDWGKSMKDCLPKYSFARTDNPNSYLSPGFNFRSTVYHEENRRTLTQNFGLKILIEVEGEGRKFDSIKFILAVGASMGLFGVASLLCDEVFKLLCMLKNHLSWNWLQFYSEDMKYDLSHVECARAQKVRKNGSHKGTATDLEAIETIQV